jgi:hypothetical protein
MASRSRQLVLCPAKHFCRGLISFRIPYLVDGEGGYRNVCFSPEQMTNWWWEWDGWGYLSPPLQLSVSLLIPSQPEISIITHIRFPLINRRTSIRLFCAVLVGPGDENLVAEVVDAIVQQLKLTKY